MAAKPKRRKSKDEAPTEPASTQSGGVNLDADNANIGGDVVGRDKLEAGGDIAGRDKITAGGHVVQAEAGATVIIGAPAPSAVEEAPAPGEPPFKGLQYFDEADADLFFGRELLTAKLVGQLREHRFLAVVGASGSGKSSVVRGAGVRTQARRATGRRQRAVAFSPDGRWLATGNGDGTARLWRVRLDELIDLACRTAGRNLTHPEWKQYFPGQAYRKTCEQWPEGE